MDLPGRDMSEKRAGNSETPELRLVLVGNISCGKTLTADTLLDQKASAKSLSSTKLCEVRKSVSQGRRLMVVETPRWYWSGQHLESSIQRETERALSLVAPGPHAFLILVPVGQFTEMENRVPAELERLFGSGALSHTLVLLTCGDYLVGRDENQYMREELQLKAMVESCGGRWHVINNRRPQDRQQVVSLLEKVEQLAQSHGGCYLQSALQRELETRIQKKEREFERKYSFREQERVDVSRSARERTEQSRGTGVTRSRSGDESEEKVTSQQVSNGLHSQPSPGQQGTAGGLQRMPSFKLNKEGAILTQMSEKTEVSASQNNQTFTNRIYHPVTSPVHPISTAETTSSSAGSGGVASCSSSSNSSASELRLVLLGQTESGKSAAGNAILGREEFKLHRKVSGAATRQCVRGTAVIGDRQVTVVDTPDWFWSSCSAAELKAHLLSCTTLCSPGPHAFLLCVPVTQPAHSILHGLGAVGDVFGPEAILKHTVVLFTYSDLLGGGSVETYIGSKRPEMLKLVEKCGDHYHVLERGKEARKKNMKELLEKVEQLVKENRGSHYTFQQQDSKSKPLLRGKGEEQLDEVDRAISGPLHSLKEVDENEEEMNGRAELQGSTASSSSWLGSILRFVGEQAGAGAKRVPKLVAGGALMGGVVGLFYGGPLGGAVGATAGSVAAEVGRRKYSKSKTD